LVLNQFSEFEDERKKGFVFDAYVFPAQTIKGTEAEENLRNFFEEFE
jgi:hypothetical protein